MDVFKCIEERRNIERFRDVEVREVMLSSILNSAIQAPSVGNLQEWHFVVVREADRKLELANAALRHEAIRTAPVLIIPCADIERVKLRYGERGERYAIQDLAFASILMALAAHALGLGCCIVRAFDDGEVARILNLPASLKPMLILALGHPAEIPDRARRLPLENVSWLEQYGKRYEAGGRIAL
jgi:nitroreductase